MTPRNMARHRNSPNFAFWKNIKTGYDHFEVTHQEPKVDVCDRRYVFDAAAPDGSTKPLRFDARGKCPVYQVPTEIASLMQERRQHEGAEFASLVNSNIALADDHKGIDGGMNPVFLDQFNQTGRDGTQIAYAAPGALPRTPNQPSAMVVPPAQAQVTQVAAQVPTADEGSVADVPVPRSAPQAKEGTALPDQTGLASLIGGIFGSSQSETQPAAQPAARPHAVAVAKHTAKPAIRTAAAPTPKTAPEAKVAAAPKQPELRPAVKPEPQVAAAKPETKPETPAAPEPEMRTAFQTPSKPATMSGAQPVVPAGSFESRWSAFRSF
jgi:hypothetical protein